MWRIIIADLMMNNGQTYCKFYIRILFKIYIYTHFYVRYVFLDVEKLNFVFTLSSSSFQGKIKHICILYKSMCD